MGEIPSSKFNTSYFLVPPLKAIVAHKIISLIYEDNVALDLKVLNNDVVEYLTNRMPFSVIFRIHEMKLAPDTIGLEFIKNYAETRQFVEETRNLIVKHLKIKHETKIGLWTAFRRSCLRHPQRTGQFWREFLKRERDIVKREVAKRQSQGNNKAKKDEGPVKRSKYWQEYGGKPLADWGKQPAGKNTMMMFNEYYELVANLAEKYKIENVPLFLVRGLDSESGVNEKIVREQETEIKSFILKMKILTNDFLPLERQCTTYAPLPIWIKPCAANKDHKYLRSRTRMILQEHAKHKGKMPSTFNSNFSTNSTPNCTSSASSSSSSSSSLSSTSSASNSPPISRPRRNSASSSYGSESISTSNFQSMTTAHLLMRGSDASDSLGSGARNSSVPVLRHASCSTASYATSSSGSSYSDSEEDDSSQSSDEMDGTKPNYYINCSNTVMDTRTKKEQA